MRRLVSAPILLLLLAAAAPPEARAGAPPVTPGPLPVRDHFLLGVGFLGLDPGAAGVLERGRWRVEALWSVANTWAISPQIDLALRARPRAPVTVAQLEELARLSSDGGSIFIDGELARAAIELRRGLGRGVELRIAVPVLSFGGGRLDGSIETFHDSFGAGLDGRNGATRDAFLVSLITRRGDFLARDAPGLGLGDIVVGVKVRVHGGDHSRFAAAVEGLVKLPTAADRPLATSGKTDLGAQLLLARRFAKWSLHGSAGVVLLGASERLGIAPQELFSATAAVERASGRRTSLVLQVSASESPFGSLATARIGRGATQATVGVKRALGVSYELFAAATDNFRNFTNSADLDFHLGISRRFE